VISARANVGAGGQPLAAASVADEVRRNVPAHGARHVAIIMDGNGRWAKARKMPRAFGHRQGVEAVRAIVRVAAEVGLEALTLYAFSSENWRRPEDEIEHLMGLLRSYVRKDLQEFVDNGVRLHVIGDYRAFPADIVALIDDALARTAPGKRMTLTIALNYGAQDELVRVARALASAALAGEIDPEAIGADAIDARLDSAGLPPLDLLIRTSGELRLSNFLLWQAAYAELYFTETLWPDFGKADLERALQVFSARERRFGGW
jgi:undecaprenyl diphosphate synthase